MTQAIGQLLVEVVQGGGEEVSFRNDYSGRGMYGSRCVGITGSKSDCMRVIAEVIKEAHNRVDDDELVFEDVVDALLDYEQDCMGRDVILYWKHIDPVEGYEEAFGE